MFKFAMLVQLNSYLFKNDNACSVEHLHFDPSKTPVRVSK
jgi:hypothetical protein